MPTTPFSAFPRLAPHALAILLLTTVIGCNADVPDSGCADDDCSQQTSAVATTLFYDDFESGKVWPVSLDGSVGCTTSGTETCRPTTADVATYPSSGWPGFGTVMTIHANPKNRPCVTANAIAWKDVPYKGGGNYQFETRFRQWRTDPPYLTHQADMNFSYSRRAAERDKPGAYYWKDRFSEVGIFFNPNEPNLHGWLYMKRAGDQGQIRLIDDIKKYSKTWATDWHHLIVNNIIAPENDYFMVASVHLDGRWYEVNEPMGTFWHIVDSPTKWHDHQRVLLESANVWRGCNTQSRAQGVAVFDKVRGTHYSW